MISHPAHPATFTAAKPRNISSMLAGQQAVPAQPAQSGIGAMLSDPTYQPPAPPPPPPQAMPPQPRSTGREMSDAISAQAAQMSPGQRAQGAQRADELVQIFGTLARKKNLKLDDVYDAARHAASSGLATVDEIHQEIGGLPSNPQQLRVAIQQRFKAAIISASILNGSQQQALQGPSPAPAAPQQSPQMPVGGLS